MEPGQNPTTIIQFDAGQNPTTIIQFDAGQNPTTIIQLDAGQNPTLNYMRRISTRTMDLLLGFCIAGQNPMQLSPRLGIKCQTKLKLEKYRIFHRKRVKSLGIMTQSNF